MKKVTAIVLTLFFIVVLVVGCAPNPPSPRDDIRSGQSAGPEKAEADQNRPDVLGSEKRVVMGFYVEGEGPIPSSKKSMTTHADLLDEVSFFWYSFDSNGNVKTDVKPDLAAKNAAQKNNAKVYAAIHNLKRGTGFDPGLAHRVLSNPGIRAKFVRNLVALTISQKWDGIALDIEKTPPQDRGNFSAFVKELGTALKAKDKILNVSIPAKFVDYPKDLWSGAYDYAAIGKGADQVVLMTYDEHGLGTTAGPIASHDWTDRVIKFAVSVIPREKIVMGIPVYAFDWASTKPTVPAYLSYDQALRTAKTKGVQIGYDEETEVPYYTYTEGGVKHSVFFENKRSVDVKLGYAKKHNLHGVAIWRMGMEDNSIWDTVKKHYGTNKNIPK